MHAREEGGRWIKVSSTRVQSCPCSFVFFLSFLLLRLRLLRSAEERERARERGRDLDSSPLHFGADEEEKNCLIFVEDDHSLLLYVFFCVFFWVHK